MLDAHGQDGGFDLPQPRLREQRCKVALSCAREVRLVGDSRIERPGRGPEDPERSLAAGVIPDASRIYAPGSRHAAHLGQPAEGSRMKWTTSWAMVASNA